MGSHRQADWDVQVRCLPTLFRPSRPLTNSGSAISFTGLNTEQSLALTDKAHIYLTRNGRISMAGLNSHNIRYVAESIDKVVRETL